MAFRSDPKRDAAAALLVESAHLWPVVRLKQPFGAFPAGSVFYSVPSRSNPNQRYLANDRACECPDYQRRGANCAHQRAVALYLGRRQREQTGSADEADPTPARPSYDDLFPSCRAYPCGGDPERGGYCHRHRGVRCGIDDCRRVRVAPDLSCEDHEAADAPGLTDAF